MSQQSTGSGGLGVAHPVPYSPAIKDPVDTMPHDSQPPGVDEEKEKEPQSLEEALTS